MNEVGKLTRLAMVALGNAVVDIDNDTLPAAQRHELASGLDNLSAALREPDQPPDVIEGSQLPWDRTTGIRSR